MPELPEVETCRRMIERELTGRAVTSVAVRLPKLLRFSPILSLDTLVGRQITFVRRRAKILIVDFDGELSLVIHLKLAGQIAVHRPGDVRHWAGHPVPDPAGPYPHKATHIELEFDDGSRLYLSDIRQFGWLRLLPTSEVEPLIASFKLGPDAVDGDGGIELGELSAKLQRRTIPIKLALLDQAVLGGVGNIYVDEALHRARIHPATPANSLSQEELERLLEAIKWAIERGIEQGGAKIIHGKAYPVDGFPAVHGRRGERCPVCGAPVVKTTIGTRATYLCTSCQLEGAPCVAIVPAPTDGNRARPEARGRTQRSAARRSSSR